MLNADAAPVRGVRVVLHRIGQSNSGPLDSTRSDQQGRFRFSFRPDTATFYLVSSRYAGIEYFSPPLATNPVRPDSALHIVVYDTSSTAPVQLESRHLLLTRPADDGSRTMLDLIMLRNAGRHTRVAADTLRGTLRLPLPRGTVGLQVSESDVSSEALRRSGDELIISAAIAPGEKQLTVQYQVPPRRDMVQLPLNGAGAALNVLAEESGVRVIGLSPADSQVIQGRSFRRWAGTDSATGMLRLVLPGIAGTPRWVLAVLVGGLALGLAAAGWVALVGRRNQVPPSYELIDAMAALDLQYLGRQEEIPEAEWSSYQAERARLKSELQASLAAGGRSR